MKKITISSFILLVTTILTLMACNEDKKIEGESVLKPTPYAKTELDEWVKKNFIEPYNVRLLYRYDDTKTQQQDYITPASYAKSVQMANIIKYLFFDAYAAHTDKDFLKKYSPKIIMLIGSAAVYSNGTEKLGLAENGVQFSLYKVNELDVENVERLYEYYFRTIYHEFSHILHQTKDYPSDFKRISAKDYVQDAWSSEWREKSSLEAGFISNYSTKDSNEDFVELIAHYLTYSPEKWTQTLEKAAGKDGDKPGKAILEQKIAIVIDYMKKTWNIDMNDLRDEIQTRASKLNTIDINALN